eukprot:3919509-Rhodomonas_salina.2
MVLVQELLGRLGRLELSDVDDGRDQPDEDHSEDDDAALEAEDEVGEGGAKELRDLVHADLDPLPHINTRSVRTAHRTAKTCGNIGAHVMERAQVHLRRRRLLVVAAAALGAAPAAVRDRASWLTLEPGGSRQNHTSGNANDSNTRWNGGWRVGAGCSPVVVDNDRGAEERHHQDVVPQDHLSDHTTT